MPKYNPYPYQEEGIAKTLEMKRNINPYVNCIHTSIEHAWSTMEVLIVEIYEP